jgi:hypothetical protein
MPERSGDAKDGWVSRYRHRRAERHVRRVDGRARRRARSGGGPMTLLGRPKAGTSKAEASLRRRAARSADVGRRRGD